MEPVRGLAPEGSVQTTLTGAKKQTALGRAVKIEYDEQRGEILLLHVPSLIQLWQHNTARTDGDGNKRSNDQINAARRLLRRLDTLDRSDHENISIQTWDRIARASRLEEYYQIGLDAPDVVRGQPWTLRQWHPVTYATVERIEAQHEPQLIAA